MQKTIFRLASVITASAVSLAITGCQGGSDTVVQAGNTEVSTDSTNVSKSPGQLRDELLTEEGSRVLHMASMEVELSFTELLRGSETVVIAEVGEPFVRQPRSGSFGATSGPTTIVLQKATVEEVLRSPGGSVLAPARVITLVVGAVDSDSGLVREGHVVLPYGSTGVVPAGKHALILNRLTPGIAEAFLEDPSEIGYGLASSYHPMTFLDVDGDSLKVPNDLIAMPPNEDGSVGALTEEARKNLDALNPRRDYDVPTSVEDLRMKLQAQPFEPDYELPAEG